MSFILAEITIELAFYRLLISLNGNNLFLPVPSSTNRIFASFVIP